MIVHIQSKVFNCNLPMFNSTFVYRSIILIWIYNNYTFIFFGTFNRTLRYSTENKITFYFSLQRLKTFLLRKNEYVHPHNNNDKLKSTHTIIERYLTQQVQNQHLPHVYFWLNTLRTYIKSLFWFVYITTKHNKYRLRNLQFNVRHVLLQRII